MQFFSFKVVFQQSSLLAPLAVDAVLKVTEEGKEIAVDLNVRKSIYKLNYYSKCIKFIS